MRLIILITIIGNLLFFLSLPLPAQQEQVVDIMGKITIFKVHKNVFYFVNANSNSIVKTDDSLKKICELGSQGEGPGEIKRLMNFQIMGEKIVIIAPNKAAFYSGSGKFLEEIHKPKGSIFLRNGCMVAFTRRPEKDKTLYEVILLDKQNNKITTLLSRKIENQKGYNFVAFVPSIYVKYSFQARQIYVSDPYGENCITIYNEDGKKIKSISSLSSTKQKVDDEFKKRFFYGILNAPMFKQNKQMADMVKKQTYFSEYFPTFQTFFLDNSGNVFIKTYVRNKGKTLFKKFTSEGTFDKDIYFTDTDINIADANNFTAFSDSHYFYLYEDDEGRYIVYKTKIP